MTGVQVIRKYATCYMQAAWLCLILVACDQSPPPDRLRVGMTFPDLHLTTLDMESDRVKSHLGKLLILNVWATWCPPCRRELPSLNRLQAMVGRERLEVLLLSVDEDTDIVREYLRFRGVDLPVFIDINQDMARRVLGIRRYPDTFVITPDGGLLRRFVGETDWAHPGLISAVRKAANDQDYSDLLNYPDSFK